tara:strand:- start:577 stop:1359 length:783 start_codon:yes stop_codon:yes gene_type:complete
MKKKYIIIVGANGYLSHHFSKNLCKNYNLILWDIKFSKKFSSDIKKLSVKYNSSVTLHKVDITKKNNIKRSIQFIRKEKIKIYGLINCAGLNPQPNIKNPDYNKNFKSFINMWDQEINISLKGYMLIIYEVSKILQKSRNSTIINFSSDLGIISPNQNIYSKNSVKPLVYSVSKHGIIGMTKYFATFFSKKGIRVNSICFGGVYNKKFEKNFVRKFSKLVPLSRMCKIEEILSPINFLLDEKNSYMTGHSLIIDGGRTIW